MKLTLQQGSVTALQQACQPVGKLLIQGCVNGLGVEAIAEMCIRDRGSGSTSQRRRERTYVMCYGADAIYARQSVDRADSISIETVSYTHLSRLNNRAFPHPRPHPGSMLRKRRSVCRIGCSACSDWYSMPHTTRYLSLIHISLIRQTYRTHCWTLPNAFG